MISQQNIGDSVIVTINDSLEIKGFLYKRKRKTICGNIYYQTLLITVNQKESYQIKLSKILKNTNCRLVLVEKTRRIL